MKIVDCYLRALQKAEENMTNGGIKLDKARFVQLLMTNKTALFVISLIRKTKRIYVISKS